MKNVDLLKNHGVNVDASLEFWGDIQSYNEALLEFKNSLQEKVNNLDYYKKNLDYDNYAILVHSMKSEAKYFGFMKEAEVFLAHEMNAKENNKEFLNQNFDNLKDVVNKIESLLDEYFNESTSKKKNILIADDSNIILKFIENHIKDEFNILKANNGKEAIQIIDNNSLYAILLDLNMPSLNGFKVLDYMQEKQMLEKLPVIVITGDDTQDTIKKAFTYPILDVLNKPFNEDNINRIMVAIKSFYERH